MKALKFKLSGKTAFFKKPDVNTYLYFTYNNIHKVAILGIFGAILGYGGYAQQGKKDFPEFYEKLKDIKISIVPLSEDGTFNKKIQSFNNSVGYASKEAGGNLIVQEQWLEDVSWEIYLMLDNEEAEKIKDFVTNKKSIFTPYLGKNDHIADISEVEILEIEKNNEYDRVESLCIKENISFDFEDFDDDEDRLFVYKEYLPLGLEKNTNLYQSREFIFTNADAEDFKEDVFTAKDKNIMFY